jgi:hypothetical protein
MTIERSANDSNDVGALATPTQRTLCLQLLTASEFSPF